ncbi:MAG: NAD(P)/FAD-dependent oxidoreductase [Clostridia bacterium]|nr:NAD(P)/FAD-dependent oxidoreductase [Clostridia bacterium]
MGNKIIVAGGGHGGIAAAMLLAQKGFDVTVYEKNAADKLGYDWTDIFDRKGWTAVGIPIPDKSKYKLKQDMTFYGPAMETALTQNTEDDKKEIQMERKDIYAHLIEYAEKAGVKFRYEEAVEKPILLGNRVVGIKTDKGEYLADLVIDACGLNSPVRQNLPPSMGIQNNPVEYEQFYVYRAHFNKMCEVEEKDKFKLILLPNNELGISWVATEENHTDVLIGRFFKFDRDYAISQIDEMRKLNPSIGTDILRGDSFANIPVRQPLGVLVADGYAAIGDSAFMTVPVIGSGIANSLKAAKILADAISNDFSGSYSAETLWNYQKNFYKEIGAALAPLACIKLLLTRLEGPELDYIFAKGILNAEDMTIDADSTSLGAMLSGMSLDDIKIKLDGLINNKVVLGKVVKMGLQLARATAVTAAMPTSYNRKTVLRWVEEYNSCFKR